MSESYLRMKNIWCKTGGSDTYLFEEGPLHEPLDHGESLWVSGDDVAVQSHVLLVQLADGRRRGHAQLNHRLVNHVDPGNTITYSDIS